jgi:hypothetical protein
MTRECDAFGLPLHSRIDHIVVEAPASHLTPIFQISSHCTPRSHFNQMLSTRPGSTYSKIKRRAFRLPFYGHLETRVQS